MARSLSLFHALLFLFTSSSIVTALESASISANLKGVGHTCVSKCLYYTVLSDMGKALGCDTPYDNNCYCATAAQSASAAGEHMERCASSMCGAGDLKLDLSTMQSIYGSYCMAAGYTQPGATRWYNPAEATQEPKSEAAETTASDKDAKPSQTPKDDTPMTTTQFNVVTQTTDGNGATRPRVIVQATSTLWINSDGSPAKLSSSSSSDNGWKIGVGVAIPAVAILGGALAWWFLRKKRRNQFVATNQPPEYVPPVEKVETTTPSPQDSISRKPVASPSVSAVSPVSPMTKTTELSAEGVSRELSGREVHLIPAPSPPVALPGQHEMQGEGQHRPEMQGEGQHRLEMQGDGQYRPEMPASGQVRPEMDGQGRVAEMTGETRPPELHGQSQSPPPQYTGNGYNGPVQERWELPDTSR